jgi:hypothetical protein
MFFSHKEIKPVISTRELVYWKNILKKLLKVGMEFEFNLPDQKGTCKGESNACPCESMKKDSCWEKCIKWKECFDGVPEKDIKCNGIYCPGFVSQCMTCPDFKVNCKTCENRYDPDRNPDNLRAQIADELRPSRSYGKISPSGVLNITVDGSLLGKGAEGKGAEIVTIGRRVDYWEFFKMAETIFNSAVGKGAYINERCSIHMHVLASYFGKLYSGGNDQTTHSDEFHIENIPGIPNNITELEKPIPEIVLANFHQLCRRYQNAITWMTTGLSDPKHLTRWEKFRVSVLDISGILNTMKNVKSLVSQNAQAQSQAGAKYGWVNYKYVDFDPKGDITRFHIEMRVMDFLLSPSAIAAVACMYYAMVIKAAEISRWGVVEVGDSEWMEQSKEVKNALLNGTGDYGGPRLSNTGELHRYYNILIRESLELIRQLKHILIKIGPAYQVLEKLAEKPASLRRCEGQSWEEIEKDLAVVVNEADIFEIAMEECIDLRHVSECKDENEWIKGVSKNIGENPDVDVDKPDKIENKVKEYVNNKRNEGEIIWSDTLGTMLML